MTTGLTLGRPQGRKLSSWAIGESCYNLKGCRLGMCWVPGFELAGSSELKRSLQDLGSKGAPGSGRAFPKVMKAAGCPSGGRLFTGALNLLLILRSHGGETWNF